MNTKLAHFALSVSKINRQHVQFLLAILALAMLIVGVGAPEGGSVIPPH
jgi:hypothetical protein